MAEFYGNSVGSKINASKNDSDARKIFVGGLSWESTVEDIKTYFQRYGEVIDVNLKTDLNTGRSRGFGFVLFKDVSSVDKVIADKSHILNGKNIDPKRALAGGAGENGAPQREPVKKIFVGGLDPALTEQEISEHFSQYGKVELVELPFDKTKNQRRAFGFVTFESEEIVDNICSNSKVPFGDKMLDVRKAIPKELQEGFAARGGRGGGRGRGMGRGAPAYDYNGTYQAGYPGYEYYMPSPPGSGYGPPNPGYGGYYGGQGYGGVYDHTAGGSYGSPGYSGYDYNSWQGSSPSERGYRK